MYKFNISLVDVVIQRIVETFSPEKIIVFGSVANGTYTEASDLDLLVVMQTDLRPHQRAVAVRESVSDIDLAMDILVMTPEELEENSDDPWDITSEIVRTGCVVYDSHDP